MEYRQLGKSDLHVSVVTFGAWAIGGWMWGEQDEADAVAAIRKAIDFGVTTIDTAPIYGFGRSERLVAEAVAGRRDEVQILTKYVLRWDRQEGEHYFETEDVDGTPVRVYKNGRPDSVMEECERSLKRLNTDYIDLYQSHWRDPGTPVEQTMEAMDKLMRQGKIRAAGVSNFAVEDIDACCKVVPLASDQPPYSMVNRGIEADIMPYCIENDIGIIPYSPLQRGLLTGKFTDNHRFRKGDNRKDSVFFRPENIRRVNAFLERLRPIAQGHDATLAQLVINWTIHRPGVTAALVGARNPKQAEENARAADFELTQEETATINDLLDELELET
jgi:aryl-alcohol dehydrogenase-like predicted oxidoreductase